MHILSYLCPLAEQNKIMKIAIFAQCPDWPLLDETQWHWHWHPQIRMDTLFNWTDVISIQAERTTKKLDNIALCASSLSFLPEELLYYNQSSSNEKFLARACFQDILCIHWHHQSCELGEKNLQRGSKVVRIIFFYFCLLQINVNRGIITRIIYFISIWIEMSWADKPVRTTTKSRNFKYLCFQLRIYSQDETRWLPKRG